MESNTKKEKFDLSFKPRLGNAICSGNKNPGGIAPKSTRRENNTPALLPGNIGDN
jgi:hypothetical protein